MGSTDSRREHAFAWVLVPAWALVFLLSIGAVSTNLPLLAGLLR